MLATILYELTLFAPGDDVKDARKDLDWFLEALTQRDQGYLRNNPRAPRLYKSGVKYARPAQFQGECPEAAILRQALGEVSDPKVAAILDRVQQVFGGERFRDYGRLLENGEGDCDNLACVRAAELRQHGIAASPIITWRKRPDGGTTYHALVVWPHKDSLGTPPTKAKNWGTECPSLLLGMSQPERAADRQEEIRKNKERAEYIASKNKKKTKGKVEVKDKGLVSLLDEFARPVIEPDLDDIVESLFGSQGR